MFDVVRLEKSTPLQPLSSHSKWSKHFFCVCPLHVRRSFSVKNRFVTRINSDHVQRHGCQSGEQFEDMPSVASVAARQMLELTIPYSFHRCSSSPCPSHSRHVRAQSVFCSTVHASKTFTRLRAGPCWVWNPNRWRCDVLVVFLDVWQLPNGHVRTVRSMLKFHHAPSGCTQQYLHIVDRVLVAR